MNRLTKLFEGQKKDLLSIYFTAGFPRLNDTVKVLVALEKAGVDFVEIGIPFSDPVADGEVIQRSSQKALANGMSLKLLFDQLRDIRSHVKMPVVLMGYINPILSMGVENFLGKCQEAGIDGVIIPDFPPDEYQENYQDKFRQKRISNILLISPQTSEERIREIDSISEGFIYMVSSYATTGVGGSFSDRQIEYFNRVQAMKLKNPLMTGFGVSNKETFQQVCKYSSGAIVGSAFIKLLEKEGVDEQRIKEFCHNLRLS